MSRHRRLSQDKMDIARDKARTALGKLPYDTVRTMAKWWNRWYTKAGHRRLGRLLLGYRPSANTRTNRQKTRMHARNEIVHGLKAHIVDDGVDYSVRRENYDSAAFFDVREIVGEIQIVLNSAHPVCKMIEQSIEGPTGNLDLREKFDSSNVRAIALTLQAWCNLERRLPIGERKRRARELREDWGREARHLVAHLGCVP